MSASSPRPGYRFAGLPIHLVVVAEQTMRALERNDSGRALSELDRVAGEISEHPELLRLRGFALMQRGDVGAALECLLEAAERAPTDGLVACQLGVALARSGDLAAAEASFRRAVDLDPELPEAWYNLGCALDSLGDSNAACRAFERALALQPGHVAARLRRAEMLKILGDMHEAERELRVLLEHDAESVPAWVGLANLGTFKPAPVELARLVEFQASDRVPQTQRIDLAFALASLLEREGDYPMAHRLFLQANSAKRKQVRWSATTFDALMDALLDRRAEGAEPADRNGRGHGLVFLVGMPRSGSTLVEQMLSSHPEVQGGGERNVIAQVLQAESRRRGKRFPAWLPEALPSDWSRLGDEYLASCGWRATQQRYFTDKTLPNWQTLGAIRRMLPASRVLYCRRDPLEMLWSCFKHHFDDAQFFTYDLDELVAYWRQSERATATWMSRWPDWIHPVVHEELLEDTEGRLRDVMLHCGIPFNARCVDFHVNAREVRTASAAQVRQPLRKDFAAARRYGSLLDGLRASIERSRTSLGPQQD
jgi:tetratricopeptide (TPR) repeat protein